MKGKILRFTLLCLTIVVPEFLLAFEAPSLVDVTFKQLAGIESQREELFPQTLDDIRKGKLFQSINYLTRQNLSRLSSGSAIGKVLSFFGKNTRIDLSQRVTLISKTDEDISKYVSLFRHYKEPTDKTDAYFRNYIALLEDTSNQIKGIGEVDGAKKIQFSEAIAELKTYLEFENSVKPLRSHLNNDPVATIVLSQIAKKKPFKEWFDDFLEYGYRFQEPITLDDLKNKTSKRPAQFYEDSLGELNKLTLAATNDLNALKNIDAAYRTVFLRLQILNKEANFGYLIQQRQLAKNGLTSITQAYEQLAKTIGCAVESALKCQPNLSGLLNLVTNTTQWMKNHPMELEVLVSELNHALSILSNSGGSVVSNAIDFVNHAYERRSSADFAREAVFGNYESINDPKEALAPEFIALTHMAPAFPYAASIVSSVKGESIAAKIGSLGGYAAAFALGGAIPIVAVTCFKIILGFGQVKLEKVASNKLSSRADVAGILGGFLTLAKTGDLRAGITKGATTFLARKGIQFIGSTWTDCREGRSTWTEKVVEIGPVVLGGIVGPIYSYCTGDMTGIGTFAGMACMYITHKWSNSDDTSTCKRVNDLVASIAQNMEVDPSVLAVESQKLAQKGEAETEHAYNNMLSTLSSKLGKNQEDKAETLLETLFSNRAFLPDSFVLIKSMAAMPR